MSIQTFQILLEGRQNKQHLDNKIIFIAKRKKGYGNYKEDKMFFVKQVEPPLTRYMEILQCPSISYFQHSVVLLIAIWKYYSAQEYHISIGVRNFAFFLACNVECYSV